MGDLYRIIQTLCEAKGTTVSRMCLDLKMSKSTMSDLKAGRKSTLAAPTLSKIASYFGVSVDYLLGNEEAPSITEADIKAAFFNGEKDLSAEEIDELWSETKEFIEFKKAQKRKK